jgi:hypothetical protein
MNAEIRELNAKMELVLAAVANFGAFPRAVLNVDEAIKFVGKPSLEAFSVWRKKYQVPACGHGRFSTLALTNGLKRESNKTYQHGL